VDAASLGQVPGFTPAGAGKTPTPKQWRSFTPVRPRGYGDTFLTIDRVLLESGSPPQVRGIRQKIELSTQTTRFTPADAGNTHYHGEPIKKATVHPRWRGENALCLAEDVLFNRFTPASAGKTPPVYHPVPVDDGSPPLMRGQRRAGPATDYTPDGPPPLSRGHSAPAGNQYCKSSVHPR
jgi:hypothetical protein